VELYLIRHADALALGERGITDDSERPLSEQGENQVRTLAQGLLRKGISLDGIVSSPLVRARQTADLLVRNWSTTPMEVEVSDTLSPDARPGKLARYLRKLGGQNLAAIGHIPHLPSFAAWLIGGKKAQIDMGKAGVACISCPAEPSKGSGTLRWLVTLDWFGGEK
jgi:phosphohistidine phosphatase